MLILFGGGMEVCFRCFFLSFLICSLIIPAISAANDTLLTSETIKDGETLVSSGGMFELGFFSPGNSRNRYVGIWYKNIPVQTVVWVANRQSPLKSNSGVLQITDSGVLALFNHTKGTIIWSTNATRPVGNPSAQLLESGNLVVKDNDLIWQSFDHPSDTYLPGMILGWNSTTGLETFIASWRSDDDPGPGEFTSHLNPTGYPQILMKRRGRIQWRSGPWNGVRFSGAPGTRNNPTLRMHKNDFVYKENVLDQSAITMLRLSPDGVGQRWTWNDRTNSWTVYNTPMDECDRFNSCRANGVCSTGDSPPCRCLDRFVPEEADRCVRRTPLNCEDDTFVKYSGVKLPDSRYSTFNDQRLMLADCRAECATKCNCTAYTQLDIREEASGCLFYYGDFIDIKAVDENGRDLYIKIASADLVADFRGRNNTTLILSSTLVAVPVLVCLIIVLIWVQRRKRRKGPFSGSHGEEAELPFFNLSTILKATRRFSVDNKIGEGGCGPVYKGVLEDGQEIAVKRLSKTSSQGVDELKNEVVLITKLQHRNLVRTLGCSAEGAEYMLIYEYMPNSSLDLILFDQTKSTLLDWRKRFNIINGIAKGLLYLHQDSRLRIIHRDIKASNILLDADMNPKISDFGIARSFGGDETSAKTRTVVGTYGYMSPEYAIDGLFSVKSDVFSFGVLVIEIVSGKRNTGMFIRQNDLNLLEYAWMLYEEGRACDLVDASLGGAFSSSQALRTIHVALLCVQRYPEERPSMSSVLFMLGNEAELPQPKQPAFSKEDQTQSVSRTDAARSDNEVTITMLEGR